jgi:hypothetical protein
MMADWSCFGMNWKLCGIRQKSCDVKLIEGHKLEGQRRVLNTRLLLSFHKSGSFLSTSEVILFYQNMYCLHTCGPAVLPDWAQVELPFMHRHPRVNDVDNM